jgi:hypothetical protein
VIVQRLAAGTELAERAPGELVVRHPARGEGTLTGLTPEAVASLRRLAARPAEPVAPAETGSPELATALGRLAGWGLLQLVCVAGGEPLLTASLTSELGALRSRDLPSGARLVLSRFALLRADPEDGLIAESPLTHTRVRIHRPDLAAVIAGFAIPRAVTADDDPAVLGLLYSAGLLTTVDSQGARAEDAAPEVRQREFHDVLMHNATRRGLTSSEIGAVYPFAGVLAPEPALVTHPASTVIPLHRPDVAALIATDPPLAQVMEQRRSTRQFAQDPVTANQLGEFLFRIASARTTYEVAVTDEVAYEVTGRPVPAAGGSHDLEFYVTALRCAGIPPGIYHYRPAEHALALVSADPKWVVAITNEAYRCAGGESVPQAVVTLASRFSRIRQLGRVRARDRPQPAHRVTRRRVHHRQPGPIGGMTCKAETSSWWRTPRTWSPSSCR